jgi:hypothetical protein
MHTPITGYKAVVQRRPEHVEQRGDAVFQYVYTQSAVSTIENCAMRTRALALPDAGEAQGSGNARRPWNGRRIPGQRASARLQCAFPVPLRDGVESCAIMGRNGRRNVGPWNQLVQVGSEGTKNTGGRPASCLPSSLMHRAGCIAETYS